MYIESRNNERIKNVVKLRDRASREENKLFFFEGAHLLEEYLRYGNIPSAVFVCEKTIYEYPSLIDSINQENVFTVTNEVFSKISTEKAPQGILTVSSFLENNAIFLKEKVDYDKLTENSESSLLFLDSIRDNGNVGTIIRTAAALGNVSCVLSRDCADIYSNKTIRATMGAMFSSKVFIADDLAEAILSAKKSRRVFASALESTSLILGEFNIQKGDCFVVGNEGNGISKNIINLCDSAVKIPMTDATESLNASAAAAILLWELNSIYRV